MLYVVEILVALVVLLYLGYRWVAKPIIDRMKVETISINSGENDGSK